MLGYCYWLERKSYFIARHELNGLKLHGGRDLGKAPKGAKTEGGRRHADHQKVVSRGWALHKLRVAATHRDFIKTASSKEP